LRGDPAEYYLVARCPIQVDDWDVVLRRSLEQRSGLSNDSLVVENIAMGA
jgi:hypothetical protein